MGKWVVLLIAVFGFSFAFAIDSEILTECKKTQQSQVPILYRDSSGLVVCANFGEGKAVEYLYNDTAEAQELGNKIYVPGALMGKKFHGFKYIHGRTQSPLFTSGDEYFVTGLIQEELMRLTRINTLEMVLRDYFRNEQKLNLFLDEIVQTYFSINKRIVPENLSSMIVLQKLKVFEKIYEAQPIDSTTKIDESFMEEIDQITLPAIYEKNIRYQLSQKIKQGLTLENCSSTTANFLNFMIENKSILPIQGLDPLVSTLPQGNNIFVYINQAILSDLYGYTIAEFNEYERINSNISIEKILAKRTNAIKTETKEICQPSDQYAELPILISLLVHGLGQVHTLKMLDVYEDRYHPLQYFLSLSRSLAFDNDNFPNVPSDLRKKIENELLIPFSQVLNDVAEDFTIDAIPCLL